MQRKRVFFDDCLIGEASTWDDVHALLRARRIFFINAPRGAEGPSAFYLTAMAVERRHAEARKPLAG